MIFTLTQYFFRSVTFHCSYNCFPFVEQLSVNGRAGTSKHRTLEDLFRPPLDLLHKGSFKSVSLAYCSVGVGHSLPVLQ